MMRRIAMALLAVSAPSGYAQDAEPVWKQLDARQAVHWGNEKLRAGEARSALEAYEHAESLEPDAYEIPFVEGLGHFAEEDYEQAREAFEKAALSSNRALADDATYGLGACDHAEALASTDDPQQAVSRLEDAIQKYENVLASRPKHEAARDAIRKAATMRRQIKQQMQEQEQQQQGDGENDESDKEKQQEQSDDQQQNEDSEQQEPSEDDQQDQENQQSDQQQSDENESQSQEEQEEEQEQSQAQQEEDENIPREQAERRMREMMQAMRQRKEQRQKPTERIRLVPVDKDW